MAGHLVYIALLVCFIAVSAALALLAARVVGRIVQLNIVDMTACIVVNAILTAIFVLMMLTAPDFNTAPLLFLLSALAVGFVLPVVFLLAWAICRIGARLVALVDRCIGANK